ncbi:MAG: F0F1 ATP synthase subunit epsilon [Acidobacteria bacterium]|nr:F0F1 ATP synthase subunit epsilon [Acidobacteriota bacterium]
MELPKEIYLEVVTPDRLLYSGSVREVSVPALNGYLGILPGHAPLLAELGVGVLSCTNDGVQHHFYCSGGFVEVLPDRVSVLAHVAERSDEIDVEGARHARDQAEQLLRSKDPQTDFAEAQEDLRQALARLEVASRA